MRPSSLLFLTLSALAGLACPGQAEQRPNVVLFMLDDFGFECVSANGSESCQTPNIDQLAASGVRFEHCHVQPLCTPTRVQLMTGKHNVRNYFRFGTLLRDETTFGQLFRDAGYRTGIGGKWQLGREVDSPQHFGFEESCLWQHTRRPPRYANPGLEYNGIERDFSSGEYGPSLVNDFALDFIQRHQGEPFFLYYPMILTHDPFQPTPDSPDWDPTTRSEAELRHVRHFPEMAAWADKMIGRVLEKLESLQLRDNTLVILLGDNGTHRSVTTRFRGTDVPGGKGTTTHRGTRVPCVVSWPAQVPAGQVNQDLISSVDFLPTILQAAGIAIPAGIDGISFLSRIMPQLGGEAGSPRPWLYVWYSPRQRLDLSVREYAFNHDFKLYRSGEFYDLRVDPEEQSPLAHTRLTSEAAMAHEMLAKALEQYTEARPEELDQRLVESSVAESDPPRERPANRGNQRRAVGSPN